MSELFKLNWKDFLQGLIFSVITATLTAIIEAFGQETFSWYHVFAGAGIGCASYLLKRLTSNSDGVMLKREVKEAEADDKLDDSNGGGAVIPGKGF